MATSKASGSPTTKAAATKAPAKAAATKGGRTTKQADRAESRTSFTAEERAAMKEAAAEMKAQRTGKRTAADDTADVLAKIAGMADDDRAMAERVHEIVTKAAPHLTPRLWYGMPAYARDGKVLCFFQDAAKFKARYATLGFQDVANLDDGAMWPTAFALTSLTKADEKRIAELVRRAAS